MNNRIRKVIISAMQIALILTAGCSVSDKDSAGVIVSATITPTYNGANTSSVDVVQSVCSNGTATTQIEYFADHGATAAFTASLVNPSNIIKQMTVYIDGYTVDYQNAADSPAAPPIQPATRQKTAGFIVSSGTPTVAATMTVEFVDLTRKVQYAATAGGSLNNYTATYTISGHSENGVLFTVTSRTDFQAGGFNNCPAGYQPL